MPPPIIQVESLGKRYRIGAREEEPRSRLESISALVQAPFSYLRNSLREASEEETLWAIRDISFEVQQGEVLGIIGRNGAGKSTHRKSFRVSRTRRKGAPICAAAWAHFWR